MSFIIGFLGAFIGIIAGIIVIVLFIYFKVQKMVGRKGSMKDIVNAAKSVKDIERQEYSRPKSVGGITKLIEPVIIRDFGDFNKDFLFSTVEKNLTNIFTAIEEKSDLPVRNDNSLVYMQHIIKEKIQDIKGQKIDIRYDDIKFHNHAIKDYNKSRGRATITVSSTVEYYYSNNSKNYKKKGYEGIKKQTRYTTEYVYVYDENKCEATDRVLMVSCPNCGAPLNSLGSGNCQYCGTYMEQINLRNWFMVSYKEDY